MLFKTSKNENEIFLRKQMSFQIFLLFYFGVLDSNAGRKRSSSKTWWKRLSSELTPVRLANLEIYINGNLTANLNKEKKNKRKSSETLRNRSRNNIYIEEFLFHFTPIQTSFMLIFHLLPIMRFWEGSGNKMEITVVGGKIENHKLKSHHYYCHYHSLGHLLVFRTFFSWKIISNG